MDINSLLNTQSLSAPNRLLENTLNLKVGQQLDVKVINAEIQAAKKCDYLVIGRQGRQRTKQPAGYVKPWAGFENSGDSNSAFHRI